jgi:hypothetical protein
VTFVTVALFYDREPTHSSKPWTRARVGELGRGVGAHWVVAAAVADVADDAVALFEAAQVAGRGWQGGRDIGLVVVLDGLCGAQNGEEGEYNKSMHDGLWNW